MDNIESAYQQDAQQFAQSDGEIASPEERTRMRMRAFNNIGLVTPLFWTLSNWLYDIFLYIVAAVLELKKDLSKAEEYYRKALKAAEYSNWNFIIFLSLTSLFSISFILL